MAICAANGALEARSWAGSGHSTRLAGECHENGASGQDAAAGAVTRSAARDATL